MVKESSRVASMALLAAQKRHFKALFPGEKSFEFVEFQTSGYTRASLESVHLLPNSGQENIKRFSRKFH